MYFLLSRTRTLSSQCPSCPVRCGREQNGGKCCSWEPPRVRFHHSTLVCFLFGLLDFVLESCVVGWVLLIKPYCFLYLLAFFWPSGGERLAERQSRVKGTHSCPTAKAFRALSRAVHTLHPFVCLLVLRVDHAVHRVEVGPRLSVAVSSQR